MPCLSRFGLYSRWVPLTTAKSPPIHLAASKLTTKLLYAMILYFPDLFFLFLVRYLTASYSLLFGLGFFFRFQWR